MRRASTVLLLVLALAAVWWFVLRDEGGDAPDRLPSDEPSSERESQRTGAGLKSTGVTSPKKQPGGAPKVDPKTAVTVRVRGVDGKAVARCVVILRPARGGVADLFKNLGWWRVDPPGALQAFTQTVFVEVRDAMDDQGKLLPLGSAVVGPFEKDRREIDIVLPKELGIAGRVLDAEGRATPDVRVEAYFEPAPGQRWAKHGEAVSDENGRFRIGRLRAGTHHLETWPSGAHAMGATRAVEAGTEDVTLELRPGLVTDFVVEDADGKPVPDCRVRVGFSRTHGAGVSLGADAAAGRTDAAGRMRFEALDPKKTYILEVHPPHTRKDVVKHTEWKWVPSKRETVRLLRALEVRGRVQYADGRPFPYASVHVSPKGLQSHLFLDSGTSRKDGTFVVTGVPEGGVRVYAIKHDRGGNNWKSERIDARAGDADVVLVMEADPVGMIVVQIEGWPEGAKEAYGYLAQETQGKPANQGRPVKLGKKGTARFEGFRLRATYTFFASTPDGKRCAYVRGIRPGKTPAVARLQAAQSITGRIEVPKGTEKLSLYVTGGGIYRPARIAPHGDFVIDGLPPGAFKVGASGMFGKQFLYKTFEDVQAGASLDIVLEPKR